MTGRLLTVVTALSLASVAVADDLVILDGVAVAPFTLLVGDKGNWGIPVGPARTDSANGYLVVETDADSGAKQVSWNGKGEAQFFIGATEPIDLTAAVAADAALVILMNVSDPPRRSAILRMGCGHPCMANADIGRLLKALPADQWLRVSIDLKCFVDGGLDATNVDTPFLMLTKQKMSLSIADVRLVDGVGPDATINCR